MIIKLNNGNDKAHIVLVERMVQDRAMGKASANLICWQSCETELQGRVVQNGAAENSGVRWGVIGMTA